MPESLFYKVAGLRPAALLKKRLWHRCFSKNTFSGRAPPVAAFGIGVGYIIPKIIVYVETGYDFSKKCIKHLS